MACCADLAVLLGSRDESVARRSECRDDSGESLWRATPRRADRPKFRRAIFDIDSRVGGRLLRPGEVCSEFAVVRFAISLPLGRRPRPALQRGNLATVFGIAGENC